MKPATPTATDFPTHGKSEQQRRLGIPLFVPIIGAVVLGGMLIAVALPSLCRAREPANRIKCASNLRQIGQAIALYAQENGGHYPTSLAILPAHEDISGDAMVCPSSDDQSDPSTNTASLVADLTAAETKSPGHKPCLSYVYARQGLTVSTATAKTVVVYEPLGNHDREGTNVLFGDGRVEFIDRNQWPDVATTSGLVITTSSSSSRP